MYLRSLAVVAIISLGLASAHAQGDRNILRLRIDTLTVESLPKQVFLNVHCKLEGTKPHNFRGFECRIAYEKYQIDQPIVLWTGTACEKAALHKYNVLSREGQILIQVLTAGDIELDLSKPVLFRIGFMAKATLNDPTYGDYRGLLECFRFDDSLSSDNGIDEVIFENNRLGWVDYKPPVVIDTSVRRTNILLATDTKDVRSDSLVTVRLTASSLDSVNIKQAAFRIALDTSVLSFVDAQPGSLLGPNGRLTIENTTDKVLFFFSKEDTTQSITGSGELLTMRFKARKREDTVCTIFTDSVFYALNDSTRVDTVFYELGPICIQGHKEDPGSVDRGSQTLKLRLVPNPVSDDLTIFVDEDRSCDLVIWNVLGELVERFAMTGTATLDLRRYAPGTYRVAAMRNGRLVASEQFVVIH